MALNFPTSPVDKQIYVNTNTGAQYVYDAANTRWTTNTFVSNVVSAFYGSVYDAVNVSFSQSNAVYASINAAFDKANNALPNVSNSVFNGNLRVTGTLLVGTNTVTIKEDHIISAEYFRMNTANHMVVIPDGNRVNALHTLANSNYNTANAAFDTANNIASGSRTISNISLSGTINPGTVNVQSQVLTDGSTINWNIAQGSIATVTLGGNRTMAAPTNLKVGTLILHVVQDGSGNRTLTWNSVFKWPAGITPSLTPTANRRDMFSFVCDGTNLYGSFIPDVR